jgi:uncharacterized membrane protein
MSKYTSKKYWLDWDIQQLIGNMLRFGVKLSAVVASMGGIIYLFASGTEKAPAYAVYTGEPAMFRSISAVIKGALLFNSSSIMQLGVLLLIATPLARVLFSFFAFLLEKDYLYTVITFIVLAIMVFGMMS